MPTMPTIGFIVCRCEFFACAIPGFRLAAVHPRLAPLIPTNDAPAGKFQLGYPFELELCRVSASLLLASGRQFAKPWWIDKSHDNARRIDHTAPPTRLHFRLSRRAACLHSNLLPPNAFLHRPW
jgi:hypothetical protein